MKRRTSRLGRILLNTLTAISLLLALATAGLWVRGAWVVDALYQETPSFGRILRLSVGAGHVGAMWPVGWEGLSGKWDYVALDTAHFRRRWIGPFRMGQQVLPDGTRWGVAAVPMWAIFLATLLLPAYAGLGVWRRARRKRRVAMGLCGTCGYDMQANPSRCSECGHEPVKT